MDKCEHDFRGLDYSKLLERWVTYCSKCNLIKDEEPISERLQMAMNFRKRGNENE